MTAPSLLDDTAEWARLEASASFDRAEEPLLAAGRSRLGGSDSASSTTKRKRSSDDLVGTGETPTRKRAKGVKRAKHEYSDLPEGNSHVIPQDVFREFEGYDKWLEFDEEGYRNHVKKVHKRITPSSCPRTGPDVVASGPDVRAKNQYRAIFPTYNGHTCHGLVAEISGMQTIVQANHNFARHYWPYLAMSQTKGRWTKAPPVMNACNARQTNPMPMERRGQEESRLPEIM